MGQGFWGGFPPAALAIPAAVENSMRAFPRRHWLSLPLWCPRGACLFGCLSPLPLALFLPPSPRPPSRRGRGRPKLFFARGFAPCIPATEPGRHLQNQPSGCPAGCCILPRLLCLPYQCFPAPYPPSPRSQSALPRRGRGRPKLFFARGFAPCIPGLEPGRHLQNQPSGCPEWGFAPCETGVAFRYPAGAWQLRRGTGKQCRQPRRGGTGGDGTIRR